MKQNKWFRRALLGGLGVTGIAVSSLACAFVGHGIGLGTAKVINKVQDYLDNDTQPTEA